ncbi:MAG: lysine-2,3-aminomutase-like protein, partial [Alphaproteobacteria bacterium]|nr:lysine-2,3-aminomutase-like protein [Alphaproteobacteria bacterium]
MTANPATQAARSHALDDITARYPQAITTEMAQLIDPADPDDPIARQFLPRAAERNRSPEEADDPIGDSAHMPVTGIVHRHRDRVLLKPVLSCPVYCRFCFRREQVGHGEGMLTRHELDMATDYVASQTAVREVIITGGDPFVLSPRRLGDLSRRFASIAHVELLRWHTRVPCVAPQRITPALIDALRVEGAASFVNLHANHPREFTPAARRAIARLVDAGIPMLSQSVLLRGVNDTVDTLEALMRSFLVNRIKPYYLHHPDLAPGTGHFRLGIDDGIE